MTTHDVAAMQRHMNARLRQRGRAPIAADGKIGPQTKHAIHLLKYLLGFPTSSLDTGATEWFRTIVAAPDRRPVAYLARAAARKAYLARNRTNGHAAKGAWGLDWAWGRPNIQQLDDLGVRFAARYLSHDLSKNLSGAQARELAAHGIDCVVVWETTANRASQGRAAGYSDARIALADARACGMPKGRPIYFAVDFDATGPDVAAYFQGVRQMLPYAQVGVYGSDHVVDYIVGRYAKFGWQTYAWSGGRVSSKARLYQYSNGHLLAGVSCDYNRALANDFGQWRP